MEGLLKEMSLHHHLSMLFGQLGSPSFWRALVVLLRDLAPLDNALVVCFRPDAPPVVLDECSFEEQPAISPMPFYCKGLYLLDPFYQLSCGHFSDGVHHLPDIAPDQFHQSEYYQRYMIKEVGLDEVQLLLRVDTQTVLSVSLGNTQLFNASDIGKLRIAQSWLLAAMQKHWQLESTPLTETRHPATSSLADQLTEMLSRFGQGKLSEREAEIARHTLCGLSSKAVAQQLGISPETVKVHRRNLYIKLGVASHAELFNYLLSQLRDAENKKGS